MRPLCMLTVFAACLGLFLPTGAKAEDLFAADAAFLGEIEPANAPPPTRARASALGVDGILAFARELSKKGLHSAALPFLRHAVEEAPQRADLWYELANTLEAAHRKDEAAAAFDRYLSLSGTAPAPRLRASPALRAARAEPAPAPARVAIALPELEPRPSSPVRALREARTAPTKFHPAKPTRERKTRPEAPPPSRHEINGMLEALGEL